MTNTPLLEKDKSNQINYTVKSQANIYMFKFNTFLAHINKSTKAFNQKPDFYKAYFKTANTLKEKQVSLKSVSPQFNSSTFSIPLKYKYKNGSTCFYLLRGCTN